MTSPLDRYALVLLAVLGTALGGCAQIPRKDAQLSETVGRNGAAMRGGQAPLAEKPSGYLIDSSGQVVRSGAGSCVRTGYWTPAMAVAECDPDLAKGAALKPAFGPAGVGAAAPRPEPKPEAYGAPAPATTAPAEPITAPLPKPEPGVAEVKIYYATDRTRTGKRAPAAFYGDKPARELDLGIAYVTIPPRPVHTRGGFEEPKWWKLEFRPDPKRHIVLHHVSRFLNQGDFYGRLRQEMAGKQEKELFVFIHGFNVTFDEGARRTAQISYDLDLNVVPILFSWTSGGKVYRYNSDEDMTDQVVDKLRGFLETLVRESQAEAVHLIAHSMGNRFMARAVRELVLSKSFQGRRPFNQVIMAAPDVKLDAFQEVLGPAIREASCHTTLYISSEDKALWASALVHGNQRTGSAPPTFDSAGWIDTVDASSVNVSLLGLNHSYYGTQAMLDDMKLVLRRIAAPRPALRPKGEGPGNYWQLQPQKLLKRSRDAFADARRVACPR